MNAPHHDDPLAGIELLRFATAGSVDDGKSTLIGRLLYDAKALFDDQLEQLDGDFDLASLTDGLRAEREQGITIDVAYRYFATPRRRFVVADCPGHLEYTRNAFTGMSTADIALLLVDVRHGVVAQTRRHTFLAGLLGMSRVIFCVNKMDLVGYDERAFALVSDQLERLAAKLGVPRVSVVPVSALEGDNVTEPSSHMPWYGGPSLLELLETLPPHPPAKGPGRLSVQCLLADEEAGTTSYAGLVAGGSLRVGDEVQVLPSGARSRLLGITTYDGPLDEAADGASVALQLEGEIAVGRGDVIAPADAAPSVGRKVSCTLCWMSEGALSRGDRLEVKAGTARVVGTLSDVLQRFDFAGHRYVAPEGALGLNDVARVELTLDAPLALDRYQDAPSTGRLLIVDPESKDTVGAALVTGVAS